ncbi:MAG: glucose-1-phosphate thymidylyltransferase [Candidatus Moranbacteria bacterium]|nr:glucose-1-phosphate thymidylyltransferase [Candidatus Moranbacteria bacterium]
MKHNKIFEPYFDQIPEFLSPLFEQARHPWQVLPLLKDFLKANLKTKNKALKTGDVYIDGDVFIDKGTVIEHGVMIKGPCYIGKNCRIRNSAYIRGGTFIDDDCVVGHASEIKHSILMKKAACPHFNYAGDSILGKNVNLGGGAILANLKLNKKNIKIGGVDTGLKKFGSLLGDDSQLGCNTVLNPGTLFEKNTIYSGKPLKSGFYKKDSGLKGFL